jgi:hypothetical protein
MLKDLCFKLASLIPHHLLKPSKAFLVCEEVRYDRNTHEIILFSSFFSKFKKKKLKVLKDACGILINIFTNAFAGKGSNK